MLQIHLAIFKFQNIKTDLYLVSYKQPKTLTSELTSDTEDRNGYSLCRYHANSVYCVQSTLLIKWISDVFTLRLITLALNIKCNWLMLSFLVSVKTCKANWLCKASIQMRLAVEWSKEYFSCLKIQNPALISKNMEIWSLIVLNYLPSYDIKIHNCLCTRSFKETIHASYRD